MNPDISPDEYADLLAETLESIEEHDTDYNERYPLVIAAIYLATEAGIPAGFGFDPKEPEWPVAYIELPTGQVSWHMPQHPHVWDGHDTATKYERCRAYTTQTLGDKR